MQVSEDERLAETSIQAFTAHVELIEITVADILHRMHSAFQDCVRKYRDVSGLKKALYSMDKYHKAALETPCLCPIDLLMKEHKPPSASGLRTRAITSHDNYFTCQISTFLHQVLVPKVFSHPFVLRDSLSFIQKLDALILPESNNLRFATFDVVALYPSIDLERGLKSLKWFLETECDFNEQLPNLILDLARFVLTHCYVACPELGTSIFHQVNGTAMGTCFSVVYAIINYIMGFF
jgi:hypothetical protein